MNIIETTFEKLPTKCLLIGFEGENLRATVRIDCASVFAEYPNATPALIVKPLFAAAYPVVVDRNGTCVDWLITSEILSFSGDGEIQLIFYKDQVICKSAVSKIRVSRSLTVTGDMPDPVVQWIDRANAKLAEVDAQIVELEGMVDTATDAATRAEQSASTASTKAEQAAGSAATATAKATEATTAATTATAKAAEAALSATQASNSAVSAADSESGATAKAAEAAQSAQTAAQKAEQITEAAQIATGKAEEASASATSAQTSATNAASSATAASASETAAKASETAAGASATQAAQSAQTASTAAQAATQKAAEASQSATNAAASATNAATSAETASTKAGEAAQSAQAAEETAEQLAESLEQIDQNTADIAEHEQEYNALKEATLIHNTASGAIASFPDGAEMPVDEVTAQINPVQDLHGYDHPWPGGGGKNLVNYLACVGLGARSNDDTVFYATTAVDGILTFTGEASYVHGGMIYKGIGAPTPPTTFTVSAEVKSTSTRIIFGIGAYEGGGTSDVNSNFTVTTNTWVKISRTYSNVSYGKIGIFLQPQRDGDVLQVKNVQLESGTTATDYAPYSNICPISGWDAVEVTRTGKNLLNNVLTSRTSYGTTFTVNSDGSITVSGTPSAQVRVPICSGLAWDGRAYVTFSFGDMPTGTRVFARKFYNGVQNYPTINPTSNQPVGALIYDVYLEINTSFNGTAFTVYPQCELGSTATAYEPYQGETYEVEFPTEAGTVYGGTLDVTTGVLTVDRVKRELSVANDMNASDGAFISFSITKEEANRYVPSGTEAKPAQIADFTNIKISLNNKTNHPSLYFYPASNPTANPWGTLTSNEIKAKYPDMVCTFVFGLITPQTYQLTAQQLQTLLGENNLWHDANGDISVGYKANTKLYIDNKIAELVARIVNS